MQSAVAEYYGEELDETGDLEFGACCTKDYDSELTSRLTEEVLEKRYGCGSPIPGAMEGTTVLDLGCGAGADCYIASQLVGENGRVIGLDMTDKQLEVARRNIEPHMKQFGFDEPNVEFRKGEIEDIPLDDGSVDIVISNCVINLSTDKQSVYDEIWRVLKRGGEFHISDIVADRRLPEHLRDEEQLWSECLAGALYVTDLEKVESGAGFDDVRIVESRATGDTLEGAKFFSQIRRGFKLDLEKNREDYGQSVIYRGSMDKKRESFDLDRSTTFPAGEAVRVSRNTARILGESRYSRHFDVSEPMRHLGSFERVSRGIEFKSAADGGGTEDESCC